MKAETSTDSNSAFDWPLAYEAEAVLRLFIGSFLKCNQFASEVSRRMSVETGTDFYDWVDHLSAGPDAIDELLRVGFVLERVDAPPGCAVYYHPRAMMARVIVHQEGSLDGAPRDLAIRPESIVDFVSSNSISTNISGKLDPVCALHLSPKNRVTGYSPSNGLPIAVSLSSLPRRNTHPGL